MKRDNGIFPVFSQYWFIAEFCLPPIWAFFFILKVPVAHFLAFRGQVRSVQVLFH